MLLGKFELLAPKGGQSRHGLSFIRPLKKIERLFYYYSFDCTLKDSLTAKNSGISSFTLLMKPESLI